MPHGYKKWEFTVRDENGLILEDECAYVVCTIGTSTRATLYGNDAGTAKTNPVTYTSFANDNSVLFYTMDSISTVDLHLWSRDGGATSVYNWSNEGKTITVDNANGKKMAIVPIVALSSATATSTDTTFDFPYGAVPTDVTLFVQSTAPGSGTLNVGLSAAESGGDIDGFLVAATCATAGYVNTYGAINPGAAVTEHCAFSGYVLGILLESAVLTSNDGGAARLPVKNIIESGAARSLVVQYNTSTSNVTGQLRVQYEFAPLPRLNVY